MKESKKEVFVVPHTHWDREWYKTFQQFRYRLTKLIDRLIRFQTGNPAYKSFMLDGQVVILEDYLEVKPEKEEPLRNLVREDKLKIGPWYTLPDTFLVNGESLVRNLLIGHAEGADFGEVMKHGWVPDPFGLTAQLPQILRGFDIDDAFMMRGVGKKAKRSDFNWQAPDGSTVSAHYLRAGYGSVNRLKSTPDGTDVAGWARDYLRKTSQVDASNLSNLFDFLDKKTPSDSMLVPVGGDHLEPQEDFPEKIEALDDNSPYKIVYGTLSEYSRAFHKTLEGPLQEVTGELRDNRHFPVLPGTLSSRIYLKQSNQKVQSLLQKYAEPLATFSWALGDGYPKGTLREAWKSLLKNHAHDSICGCSIDQVHTENELRFENAGQIAEEVVKDKLDRISHRLTSSAPNQKEREDVTRFTIFNPHPWKTGGEVAAKVEESSDLSDFHLEDPKGNRVEFQIGEVTEGTEHVLSGVETKQYKTIQFHARGVPGLGIKEYSLHPGGYHSNNKTVRAGARKIENQRFAVSAGPDGSLLVRDKETGREYNNFHYFEDLGDAGDLYNFSPPKDQKRITTQNREAEVKTEANGYKATLVVDHDLELPVSLTEDRTRRSGKTTICPITSYVTLYEDERRIDIKTKLQNRAKDHRLRVVFPTGLKAEKSFAESAFYVSDRKTDYPDRDNTIEDTPTTHPQGRFMALEEGGEGIAILNKGLPEYEATPRGSIYLTLVRAVDSISRDDLGTREGHAGPPLSTPEAQCKDEYIFEYAIFPFSGNWQDSQVVKQAREFNSPLVSSIARSDAEPLETFSFLKVEPDEVLVSTIKRGEDDESLIVRLLNPTNESKRGNIEFNDRLGDIRKAYETNLQEKPNRELALNDENKVQISLEKYEIRTLKIKF
ncbi:hypothetical protein K9M78_05070 [Candidatus Bipolaricaulota bacterium]|nr:hypothetical protein [Candidatus Bipolaricaulota bacterium]